MPSQRCIERRRLLQGGGALALASWWPAAQAGQAHDEALAFEARSFTQAIEALGGMPATSAQIELDLPQVADDGAVVPLRVTSHLPGTREVFILVDGNPQPLAARFSIPEGTEPFVAARIRMARSGSVLVAVRSDEGLFATARTLQVVVGGCG